MTSATEKSIKELYPLVMDEFDRDPAKAPQTASAIPKPAAVPQPTNPVTITKEKASIARHEPQVNSEPDALTEYLSSLTQERQREIKKYSNLPESDLEIPTEKRAAAILATFCKKYATVPKGQRNTSLFLYSCTLRRCGMTESEILERLWQFSREHCKPPHDPTGRDDVAELAQLSRRAARHVRPGFPAEKKVKAKGEHTTVANVSNPAPAAIDLDPCGIDPGNITGEEIKDLML
ncbi:primase C-terminal domain-containing protein [Methanoregula sp.]|uniref:primase C-terminal domain-containing protein n=1 Tax=Methanoregula sp. TaxID=2052170 RepID=UPI003FD78CCE